MKIAIVLPSLALGGVEKVMVNLANNFAHRKHEVHMVLCSARDSVFIKQLSNEVQLHDLKAARVRRSLFPLIRYLKTEKPDILLAGQNHMNVLAVWAKLLSRIQCKLILTLHSHISLSNANDWIPTLAKLSYPYADGMVAVSQGVAKDHIKRLDLPEQAIQVLSNPAITSDIFDLASQPLNQTLSVCFDRPVVISVGRLAPEKEYTTLIRCFNLIKDVIPHNLVILGEGPQREELEAVIHSLGLGERIFLPGFVENPYAAIAKAKLFVLTSRWEGLPTVLIESAVLGTGIVAVECDGTREALLEGRLGTLIPPGDEAALGAAIIDGVTNSLNVHVRDLEALNLYWHETASENYLQYLQRKLA